MVCSLSVLLSLPISLSFTSSLSCSIVKFHVLLLSLSLSVQAPRVVEVLKGEKCVSVAAARNHTVFLTDRSAFSHHYL